MFKILYIIILISSICSVNGKRNFSIGAIFPNNETEHEIVFRSALDRINVYERNYELISIIQYGKSEDSFVLEKIACNLISLGVIAIFGPSSESDVISSICNALEIPYFVYDWEMENTPNEKEYHTMTINLYPDNSLLTKAYADIIKDFTWRSYTIVYETRKDLIQIQDILQVHGPKDNAVTVRKLPDDTDYRPFLKKIKISGESCIILHCSIDKIIPILRQAKELKMLGEYQSIFLAPLDSYTISFDEIPGIESNITSIRITDLSSLDVRNAVNDWELAEKIRGKRTFRMSLNNAKTTLFTIYDALWVFSKSLADLEISEELEPPKVDCKRNKPWQFGRRITAFIKAKSHEKSTGRIDFNDYGQRIYFEARIIELASSGFQDIAKWDPVHGVGGLYGEIDFTAKRIEEKLQNKTFIVTSRIGAPFLMDRKAKEGETLEGNARYEGYSMDLIDSIAKLLGFKYRFELAPDGRYGSYNPVTKKWDGLVKQILDGKADLGICDLTMTSARRKVVDFTPPFMTLGISILYKKPESPPSDLFSFLSPFSLDVWIYMGTALLGVSLLMYALARMASDDWENPHPCAEPDELENCWTITNTTWLVIGSIMGQGCDLLPKAASTRLATGMWWFFALMMLNSYTANLAAFLTMSRMDAPIENAEDLAKQSKIKYGAVSGGSTQAFFRESNFSIYQRMWAAMESARPSVFTKNNDEGVDRVNKSKGLYAYLMESTTLEYIIERNCELQQIGGWLDSKTYGIAMPFNSPYRKQISEAILKLGESGQLAEIKRKWWKEKHGGGKCSQVSEATADTPELDIENVGGVFLVLGCGLFVAVIIGIGEFLWNIRKLSVEEKISPWEAIKSEIIFVASFWETTKPVHTSSKDDSPTSNKDDDDGGGDQKSKRSTKSKSKSIDETKSTNTSMNNCNNHNHQNHVKENVNDKNNYRKKNSNIEILSMKSIKSSSKSSDDTRKHKNKTNLNV